MSEGARACSGPPAASARRPGVLRRAQASRADLTPAPPPRGHTLSVPPRLPVLPNWADRSEPEGSSLFERRSHHLIAVSLNRTRADQLRRAKPNSWGEGPPHQLGRLLPRSFHSHLPCSNRKGGEVWPTSPDGGCPNPPNCSHQPQGTLWRVPWTQAVNAQSQTPQSAVALVISRTNQPKNSGHLPGRPLAAQWQPCPPSKRNTQACHLPSPHTDTPSPPRPPQGRGGPCPPSQGAGGP